MTQGVNLIDRLKQFVDQSASMLNLDEDVAIDRGMTQIIKSAVMVIGGGEDKVQDRKILKAFIESSGGSQSRIAIIPCASREPDIIGRIYHDIFTELGASAVEVLDIRERPHYDYPEAEALVDRFTGIFMTGGDQLRLCVLIADTPFAITIAKRIDEHRLVLAGTSAGAAAMGYHMISGGSSGESPHKELVNMGTGLNILPEIIVDQHFHNRNRMARLMTAIAAHPDKIGIGIDEDILAPVDEKRAALVAQRAAIGVIHVR